MNIAENLTRIIQGKKDIVDTIAETGCPIPLDIKIEDIPEYIDKLKYKAPAPEVYDYLTFKCDDPKGTSTIKLTKAGTPYEKQFEYSTDLGNTWNTFNIDETYTISNNTKFMLKSTDSNSLGKSPSNYYYFVILGDNILVLGNIMSLINFSETMPNYCFLSLFKNCAAIVKIAETLLPATTLASSCYYLMFQSCTRLTTLPLNLLPATTLVNACYTGMFLGCVNLENTPKLPALTLGTSFIDYLARYNLMFLKCFKLNKVYCNALYTYGTTKIGGIIGQSWLDGVSSTGTFYKNKDLDISTITRSVNGIPTDWTVEDYE